LKVLVVGYGSIGKRHVDNLLRYCDVEVIVCTKISKNLKKNKRCHFFKTIQESIKEKPNAAIICSITNRHVADSILLANAGIHLLIEKPLSNTLLNTKKLLQITEDKKLITLIGCNLRFHPCILKIKELLKKNSIGKIISVKSEHSSYLPDWHPEENYQTGYAANTSLGGGVLLTSIHEIDYLFWFFGDVDEVFAFSEKISTLKIKSDDFASILLRFKNNLIAEIHLNYFQGFTSRGCKIIGSKGVIIWNHDDESIKLFNNDNKKWKSIMNLKKFDFNDTYVDEVMYFLKCVRNKKKTLNSISDGIETLRITLSAKKASKTKKVVILND
jgi:predicted dehydrogenase